MKWKEAKKIIAANPEVATALEENEVEYQVMRAVLAARKAKKMSQGALAEVAGTRQSNIARLESGTYNPSVKMLARVARGLGKKLEIRFV